MLTSTDFCLSLSDARLRWFHIHWLYRSALLLLLPSWVACSSSSCSPPSPVLGPGSIGVDAADCPLTLMVPGSLAVPLRPPPDSSSWLHGLPPMLPTYNLFALALLLPLICSFPSGSLAICGRQKGNLGLASYSVPGQGNVVWLST